jgi:hypothetical protein
MGQQWEVGVDGSLKAYGVHQNLLLNGGFEIDQTNSGSIYTNPTNGIVTLDSWTVLKSGGTPPSANVKRVARADVGAQVDSGDKAMNVVVTSVGTVDAIFAISQVVPNYLDYVSKTISVTIRIYSSIASVIRLSIDDGVTEAFSSYHPGGSAYQTLNVSKTISNSATYLRINVFKMTASQVTAGSFYVDSGMMVISQFPVPFAQRNADYQIDGSRISSGSINQDRINTASFSGSGIGFNATGTVQTFFMASPPTGWTQVVSQNDRNIRVVSGAGGGTGGSFSPASGLNLSHSHSVNSHTHTFSTTTSIASAGNLAQTGGQLQHAFTNHTHTLSGTSDATAPGTNSALGSYTFQYCDVIFATKN